VSSELKPQRRLHAFVSGRVQGVGFRYYVMTEVSEQCPNVVGKVRNVYDGQVEVLAEGSEVELRAVLEILRVGPRWSVVENVTELWGHPRGDLGPTFTVSMSQGDSWYS
jgi:acylphosphatase